jgi:HK97 gp10 family phage protein
MASLKIVGFDGFESDIRKLSDIPDGVLDEMMLAEAEVIEKAQREKGRAYGVHLTGVTLGSIKKGRILRTKDGRAITIAPQGTNKDGNRNAEVAFVNEFGKTGQPARPFIRDANEENTDKAVEAAEKVYDDWINKNIGI